MIDGMSLFSPWPNASAVIVTVALLTPATAEVLKLRDVDISPERDHRVLFASGVTPTGDVLSFVAKSTGIWKLYRVRKWNTGSTSVQSLTLPGYFSKADAQDSEGRALGQLHASVFTTTDGAYAICVGSATWWKRVNGRAVGHVKSDDFITIVDLSRFVPFRTAHTRDLGLFEFRDVKLDGEGYLLVDTLSENRSRGAFCRLALPSLLVGPMCRYNWITKRGAGSPAGVITVPAGQYPEPEAGGACSAALGSTPFSEYASKWIQSTLSLRTPGCEDNNRAEFCRWISRASFTSDGKFGVAYASEGHDNLLGNWVETNSRFLIFSVAQKADVGQVRVSTGDSFRTATAVVDSRDFLLLVSNGTHLTVYELRD
jgi:hypothetical protein